MVLTCVHVEVGIVTYVFDVVVLHSYSLESALKGVLSLYDYWRWWLGLSGGPFFLGLIVEIYQRLISVAGWYILHPWSFSSLLVGRLCG